MTRRWRGREEGVGSTPCHSPIIMAESRTALIAFEALNKKTSKQIEKYNMDIATKFAHADALMKLNGVLDGKHIKHIKYISIIRIKEKILSLYRC